MLLTGASGSTRQDFVLGAFAGLAAFISAVSCAPKGSGKKNQKVITECVVADGQQFSLQGRWAQLPIKVSFKSGDWNGAGVTAIQGGADTWNSFFNKSKGLTMFYTGPTGVGNLSTSNQNAPSCSSGTLSDGTVIYQRASTWTKSATAIAITTTCYSKSSNGGLARIFNSIMEFNYVNFFSGGAGRYPDLQSIALHEFGHLLGLDHSCGPLGGPNSNKPNVGCPDPNASPDDPLVQAVMFRNVLFDASGNGEVKQDLQENDQGRANCLYE